MIIRGKKKIYRIVLLHKNKKNCNEKSFIKLR